VELLQLHDAILDFWDPLIGQEVIKIESSNLVCEYVMHSSFTTVKNFIRWWAYLRHPVMLKQWEIEDSIVISRPVNVNRQ